MRFRRVSSDSASLRYTVLDHGAVSVPGMDCAHGFNVDGKVDRDSSIESILGRGHLPVFPPLCACFVWWVRVCDLDPSTVLRLI